MTEQRELLPIDPESVRWGTYDNDHSGIAYAKGRGLYEGIVFIQTGNVGNLEETRREVEQDNNVHGIGHLPGDTRIPFVVGVGIDRERSRRLQRPVYDCRKLGVWRTPWWEIDEETLGLLNMRLEDLHPSNRKNFLRYTTPEGYEAIELR